MRLPVPGPTSRTVSVCLRKALATIASATPGFLRICWLGGKCQFYVLGATTREIFADPKSVFILKMLCAVFAFAVGDA